MKESNASILAMALAWALLTTSTLTAQAAPDPQVAAFLSRLEGKLEKHPFFTKVEFDKEDKHAPFVFYVQRPDKADPLYVRRVLNSQVPFLRELLRVFEATYVEPLLLQRHASAPAFAIAILSSRGSYDNYARATRSASLHRARAHYDPALQLAVTYEDTFSDDPTSANIDERHSLLHEMVHALQHAYSADGQMPTGLWFIEGLAEYRSSCGHMPDKLAAPELSDVAMRVLAMAAGRPELRHHLAELKDLLGARTYIDVVKHATARGRAAGTPTDDDFALGTFYAQASMFVRFLHEGEAERYRPAFMKCMGSLMQGTTSSAAWSSGFNAVDLGELDRQFRVWLTDVIRDRGQLEIGDLAPRVASDPKVAIAGMTKTSFDPKALAWRPEDAAFRLDAARQLCSIGDYNGALRVLPGADEADATDVVTTERGRIEAVRALRDRVIDDLVQARNDVEVELEGRPTRVRILRRAVDGVVASAAGKETTLPLSAFRPSVMLAHCWRKRWLSGTELWLDRWLRWLTGTPLSKLRPMLSGAEPMIAALRGDLQQEFVDSPATRNVAVSLLELQQGPLPEVPQDARRRLSRLQELAREHSAQPVFAARRPALVTAARALAERAFSLDDVTSLGLSGKVEARPGKRFRVVYEGTAHQTFDLRADHAYLKKLPTQGVQIAFAGDAVLRPSGNAHEMLGEGFFRWAVPLTGKLVVELDRSQAAGGQMQLLFCDDKEGSHLEADTFGLYVFDLRSQPPLVDHVGVVQQQFEPNRAYRLRAEHDGGSQARVALDGKELAPWRAVGTRSGGWLGLYVFSSNPIHVHRLTIEGELDTREIPALRERFVKDMVAQVEGSGR